MLRQDFFYELPGELIAQTPANPRDASRLLYYNREDDKAEDLIFRDIADILRPDDLLVVNNTKVINARLFGRKEGGREFEIFLLKRIDSTRWEVLLRPARKIKVGGKIIVNEELSLIIEGVGDNGVRIANFTFRGSFEDILERCGEVPLPPYIREKIRDKDRYQTVYAKTEGSSAAPTAGLHFTDELLTKLRGKGIEIVEILLHVGLGTFRPVAEDEISDHKMHSEYLEVTRESAEKINSAIAVGKRIIAVGTTSVRALEASATSDGYVRPGRGETDIFIYPGYKFKIVKGLITNFHLPESTLIMLVSAFAGREKVLELYRDAVEKKYRFFSFGDAMLIL